MDLDVFSKSSKLFCQAIIYRVIKPSLGGLTREELTEVQLSCLKYVAVHPEPSVGEIADGLAFSNAASAKLIDRLVRKKLLTREEDPLDRRVLKIKLTPKGAELLKDIQQLEVEQFQHIIQRMSSEELQALELGLNAFIKAILETPEQIEEVCLRCGWSHVINCPGNLRYRELTGRDKTKV